MDIKMAYSPADLATVAGTLLQLRGNFDQESLLAQITEQQNSDGASTYTSTIW
ncbi:MAG TPA: hypothetical protein VHX52_10135 [Steroidobacteraceae bacterium]|jgi:hypothetical protein|nr:hypothetical protein [Steroidobacteraceae bacterium]